MKHRKTPKICLIYSILHTELNAAEEKIITSFCHILLWRIFCVILKFPKSDHGAILQMRPYKRNSIDLVLVCYILLSGVVCTGISGHPSI